MNEDFKFIRDFGREYIFVDIDYEVESMKESIAGSVARFDKEYDDYGAFFVIVGDGDFDEVWGIYGNIPYNDKIAYRVI